MCRYTWRGSVPIGFVFMIELDFYTESVSILRYRLWQLGLDYRGTKNVLIQRLEARSTEEQTEPQKETFSAVDGYSIQEEKQEKACKGRLVQTSVWVTKREYMMELGSTLSGFGKGSLSRTIPVFGTDAPEAFRGKAARQRAKATRKREALETNANEVDSSEPCLEIPFAKNSVAVDMCRLLSSPVMDNPLEEHLQLCLWEAFYASFISKKLRILDASDSVTEWTDPNETYAYFCRLDSKFPYYLAVYCYYRQRGWSPHSGLKYGTDFVLYYGTVENHIHSPFCVLVDIHKDDSYDNCLLDKSWISLQNRLRLVKQVAKQLLLVHVQKPKWLVEETLFSHWNSCLSLEIAETLVERWTAVNKRRKRDGRE